MLKFYNNRDLETACVAEADLRGQLLAAGLPI